MSNKNCKVDIVKVSVEHKKNSTHKLDFDEILAHNKVNNKELNLRNKLVHFSIVENNDSYIIGFVRVTIDKDLPPKIDRKSKKISSLGLTEEEGIAYGNVFLYSKKLKVLFYEVNRDSIYLDVFRIFLYKCFNSSKKMNKEYTFNIHFSTIFRKDEYRRALDMDKYKGFKMKVYQPQKLLKELKTINSSLEDKIDFDFMPEIENAAKLNSEYAQIEYTVQYAKKKAGLYKDKIESMIRKIGQMLKFGQLRDNIQEIEICGYNTEYASSQVAIDLVGDVYSGSFQLNIPRLNNSLQITERVRAIKGVFEKEFSILENY